MVYLDYMEILVPAFVGELLSCIAEVSFTSSYHLEMRCAVWAEDLAQSMSAWQQSPQWAFEPEFPEMLCHCIIPVLAIQKSCMWDTF